MQAYTTHLILPSHFICILNSIQDLAKDEHDSQSPNAHILRAHLDTPLYR